MWMKPFAQFSESHPSMGGLTYKISLLRDALKLNADYANYWISQFSMMINMELPLLF
jgi:hypothetical protein